MDIQIDVGDLIASGALVAAIVGLTFTFIQIRRGARAQRGAFFKDLYEPFFLDPEMRRVFELMELEQWSFEQGFGAEDEKEYRTLEKSIERLLAHLEIICSLYRRGLITVEDMHDFDYNIQRLVKYPGFDEYLAGLEDWRRRKGLLRAPYTSLASYIEAHRDRLSRDYE